MTPRVPRAGSRACRQRCSRCPRACPSCWCSRHATTSTPRSWSGRCRHCPPSGEELPKFSPGPFSLLRCRQPATPTSDWYLSQFPDGMSRRDGARRAGGVPAGGAAGWSCHPRGCTACTPRRIAALGAALRSSVALPPVASGLWRCCAVFNLFVRLLTYCFSFAGLAWFFRTRSVRDNSLHPLSLAGQDHPVQLAQIVSRFLARYSLARPTAEAAGPGLVRR
jgi:hypothetical protein